MKIPTLSVLLALVATAKIVEAQCADSSFSYDGDFYEYSYDVVPVCSSLQSEFERDLLNPKNLYRLQKHFFPDNSAEPNVLQVYYFINFTNVSSELCPGVMNDENKTADLVINENSTTYSTGFIWTSSATFATISPTITTLLQSSILFLLDTIVPESSLNFTFGLNSFHCAPSESQLRDVLKSTTIKVRIVQ